MHQSKIKSDLLGIAGRPQLLIQGAQICKILAVCGKPPGLFQHLGPAEQAGQPAQRGAGRPVGIRL
jgi:hypothetical protein